MNLFVAKLNHSTTSQDLQKLFAHYGFVTAVKVIMDHSTGRSKGYGFVEMPEYHQAIEAVKELDATLFQDVIITVRKSEPSGFSVPKVENQYRANFSTPIWNRHDYTRNTTRNPKSPQEIISRRNFGYRGSGYKSFDH